MGGGGQEGVRSGVGVGEVRGSKVWVVGRCWVWGM